MKLICKSCQAEIPSENVNVQEGICYCSECDEIFKLASFLKEGDVVSRIEKPAYSSIDSYTEKDSFGFIIPPAGFRGTAIFFLCFTLFWNAISWTFFFGSISEADLFIILFLIPFLLIGVVTFGLFLFYWKGMFSLLIDRDVGYAVWSVFRYKYKKSFDLGEVLDVVESVLYTKNYQPVYGVSIECEDEKSIKFGSSMTEEERKWCIGEIRHFLDTLKS